MNNDLNPLTDLFAVAILCAAFLIGCLFFGV